jgi:hypothetical protein
VPSFPEKDAPGGRFLRCAALENFLSAACCTCKIEVENGLLLTDIQGFYFNGELLENEFCLPARR